MLLKAIFIEVVFGAIWGTDSYDNVFYKPNRKANWEQVPGKLKRIDASGLGVSGVNKYDDIFYRIGTNENPSSVGTSWQRIPGKLKWITSDDKHIIGVNTNDQIFFAINIKFDVSGRISLFWMTVGESSFKHVSIMHDGNGKAIWGVDPDDRTFFKNGGNETWLNIPGRLKQIDFGTLGVFGVDFNNDIYYRVGTLKSLSAGSQWQKIGRKLKWISTSENAIWGVNADDYVFYASNISFNKVGKISMKWNKVGGKLKQVSVNNYDAPTKTVSHGAMWGLNEEDFVYFRPNKSVAWQRVPGNLKQVEIGPLGVFGVNKLNDIFYRVGTHTNPSSSGSSWQKVNGKLKFIASGGHSIWGVNADNEIYVAENISFNNNNGHISLEWKKVTGSFKHISVF